MTFDNQHNSMREFIEYDFSSNVLKVTQAQIDTARKERDKLQKVHEGALQIDVWGSYE